MTRVEYEIGSAQAGGRLDALLAEALGSRARAQRLIAGGRVTVDGVARAKSHVLAAGERVVVDQPVAAEPTATAVRVDDSRLTVRYEDEHLLVIDKPAGMVVHPGRGNHVGTLAQILGDRLAGGEDASRAGIVHRLDRDTSGLLVAARSERAHRGLRAALAAREIRREYAALVDGRPPSRTGTIDAPIGRDPRVRTRMSVDADTAKEARTHFEIEEALSATTLLAVRLETGRTHQIRVHLEAIGHPVLGDPDYGGAGRLGLERQFLHARKLAFAHPITGVDVEVSSPLAPDLVRALERARAGER